MLSTLLQKFRGGNSHALFGQVAFMAANLLVFILLLKRLPQEQVGVWGIFMTLMAIVDGIRQGLLQSGLTRQIILSPEREKTLVGTALLIHFAIIVLASLGFYLSSDFLATFWKMPELATLLRQSWKALLTLGTLQGLAALAFAKDQSRNYLIQNLVYFVLLILALGFGISFWVVDLEFLLNIQLLALVPVVIWVIGWGRISVSRPNLKDAGELLNYGKFIAGTNLFSLLFQKADLLMIGYFLDPVAVGLFHFATRLLQYIELPLTALGQSIYPKITASYRSGMLTQLKSEYSRSVQLLFALIIPGLLLMLIMHRPLILVMSTAEFLKSVPVLFILAIGTLAKPLGRVSGMTLDAIGHPKVNFLLLLMSLVVNVVFNFILIQKIGLLGAALATSISVILTVIIGQWKVSKYLQFKPFAVVWADLKTNLKLV